MSASWTDWIALGAAGFSAIAAGGSWWAAHRANETSRAVAKIERDRWHAELTPIFDIEIKGSNHQHPSLDVQLRGPVQLLHLDSVHISIANDDHDRSDALPGPVTQAQVDAQVWGPYRFSADGTDANGRAIAAVPMIVGRGRPFALEKTRAPHWWEGDDVDARWIRQYNGKPLRLVITCTREGHRPWVVPYEIGIRSRAVIS